MLMLKIMDYTSAHFKMLFETGGLLSWSIERHAMSNEWVVSFFLRGFPSSPSFLIDTRRKEVKTFKDLDAAVRAVEEIGFSVKKISSCT